MKSISLYRKYDHESNCNDATLFYKDTFGITTTDDEQEKKKKKTSMMMSSCISLSPTFNLYSSYVVNGDDDDNDGSAGGGDGDGDDVAVGMQTKSESVPSGASSSAPAASTPPTTTTATAGGGGGSKSDEYSIWIESDTKEEADTLFEALSSGDGGKARMPMNGTDCSGSKCCTDQFGKNWIISYNHDCSKHDTTYATTTTTTTRKRTKTTTTAGEEDEEEDKMTIDLYLGYHNGDCLEAFEFYKNVVFANYFEDTNSHDEFESKILYNMCPPNVNSLAPINLEQDGTKIMHMSIKLPLTKTSSTSNSTSISLMGCDVIPTKESKIVNEINSNWSGYTISVLVNTTRNDTTTLYNKLVSNGGTVIMPLQNQFWGDYLGACLDQYGNTWNISYNNNANNANANNKNDNSSKNEKRKSEDE